jgi:hypothetical protein
MTDLLMPKDLARYPVAIQPGLELPVLVPQIELQFTRLTVRRGYSRVYKMRRSIDSRAKSAVFVTRYIRNQYHRGIIATTPKSNISFWHDKFTWIFKGDRPYLGGAYFIEEGIYPPHEKRLAIKKVYQGYGKNDACRDYSQQEICARKLIVWGVFNGMSYWGAVSSTTSSQRGRLNTGYPAAHIASQQNAAFRVLKPPNRLIRWA